MGWRDPANLRRARDDDGGLMASGDLLQNFFPTGNEPPTSNYATFDTRNSHPVLDFDDTTAESAIWTGILFGYGGSGITVLVGYSATSATSGSIGFTVEIERIGDQQLDVD